MLSGSCGTRDRPYIFALPGAPAQRDLSWVLSRMAVASLLPALVVRAVWRWNGSFLIYAGCGSSFGGVAFLLLGGWPVVDGDARSELLSADWNDEWMRL